MITVIVTTWQVPFDQVVNHIARFKKPESALKYINEQSKKWWIENDGDRCVAEGQAERWVPVEELGYNHARYLLWDGEAGFHAMLDQASYAKLHEEHYKREYDAKGLTRPGYLINSYVVGAKPGGTTADEREKYAVDQEIGLQKLAEHFADKFDD